MYKKCYHENIAVFEMNGNEILVPSGHRCPHRGLKKYPSIDKKIWDASSKWILQWDNIVKHPGARARGCHCDIHKPPWLYPELVGKDTDEPDRAIKSAPLKRTAAPLKRGQFGPAKTPSSALATSIHATVLRATTVSRSMSHRSTSGQAGAVDEETFLTSFEDVPTVNLFSAKDLEEQMKNIKDIVGDDKKDWKQRTESMKKLRAIVLAGGMNYENFLDCLKSIQRPFETACTDLRSQVVREACITLAFLSQHLKTKFASFGEAVLLTLMNLIQNSAKVVATAGAVAVRFILQNTHCSRFIPIITSSLNSKSKDIRRASCEYLNSILQTWPTQMLQKHVMVLQEAIKKGIADSDSEARVFARKSYWAFKEHFPEQAEILLNSLDATYKRSLMSLSNSGSINSLNVVTRSTSVSPRASRPALSATGSTENLHQTPGQPHGPLRRTPSLPRSYRQSGIPILQRPTDNHYRVTPGVRSTSAIDLQAAQRAKARLTYGNMSRYKATLPRHSKSPDTAAVASPERTPRTRTRVAGVSQSQPSSRSGSPSSRLSYTTYNREGESLIARPRKLSGHGIRSTGNSREPSPQRFGMDRSFGSKMRGRSLHMSPTDRPQSRPVLAQKMLQQSREAESALADAFTFDSIDSCYNRATRVKSEHSDDSETSSICSERSMDSFRRPSDSFSWSGSQQRLYRDNWDQSIPKDIKEIIENCAHKHWGDRKEGLLGLQHFLANGRTLSASELRKVTDIFTKMFMDSHTKVFSLFLDTLNELITTHNEDLSDWLYVLCARLLNKLGTDLLGSIQAKIHRTLDVVRESFPGEQLLPAVMRYLTDPTQTPNSRVKVASLTFVTQIAETAEPSALNNSAGTALARLLDWTSDVKSQDVRRHAQEAFIALYNLNPPQVTMILAELPKYYQEAALPLVQNYLKSSGSSNPASPGTPPPRAQHSPARNKKNDVDTADENLEEVYKSLRRTTAEIQNYGFERLERATTSKDSGISNMADLEERIEGLTLSNSGRSSSVSSPTQRGRSVTNITVNGSSDTIAGDLILPQENNGYKNHGSSPDSAKRPEILDNMIKTIQSKCTQTSEKITALQNFQAYVREGDSTYVKQNFKKLLKTLLDRVNSDSQQLQIEVLQTLIEMLKCPELLECFSVFPELLVLKVITAHKFDDQKADGTSSGESVRAPVLRTAEKCAATIATVLRPEQIILVVSTIITTEPYPLNMGAIKMLHKIVEHWGREAIEPHLSKIMPGLIKAYDDAESTVRKSAVFCMVAIHAAVGEEVLKPHLSSLYASKLKLLYIYIQRAQQTNSQPASPRSNSKN
ncbi:PREDICTED: CLIP-associating protein 2 isoform X14 [Polistes dominula]|uniref:CLIP-associating protein 2 isoform X14 n=1 Tax=Polistes dominula TaxID=743375 RepID=A0ABM1HWU0_POLDO|nr:PREDICTED: CLIP-associating protein 2 isoform X14 [Polistes dominula]